MRKKLQKKCNCGCELFATSSCEVFDMKRHGPARYSVVIVVIVVTVVKTVVTTTAKTVLQTPVKDAKRRNKRNLRKKRPKRNFQIAHPVLM